MIFIELRHFHHLLHHLLRIRHLTGCSCRLGGRQRSHAAAGDVAGVCANKEVAINVAKRIVINDVKVFMAGMLPAISGEWQVDQSYFVTFL